MNIYKKRTGTYKIYIYLQGQRRSQNNTVGGARSKYNQIPYPLVGEPPTTNNVIEVRVLSPTSGSDIMRSPESIWF